MGSLISLTYGEGTWPTSQKKSHCRATSYPQIRSQHASTPKKLVIKREHGAVKAGLEVPRLIQNFSPIRNPHSGSDPLLIVPNPSILGCFKIARVCVCPDLLIGKSIVNRPQSLLTTASRFRELPRLPLCSSGPFHVSSLILGFS